jgi:hypothetical protein
MWILHKNLPILFGRFFFIFTQNTIDKFYVSWYTIFTRSRCFRKLIGLLFGCPYLHFL